MSDILRTAFIAAATAAAFNFVGSATQAIADTTKIDPRLINVAGHAGVGCLSAVASGGHCGPGALSAGIGSAAGPLLPHDLVGGTVARAAVGGLASLAGGGKFENGAVTAAFGYLYNECAHGGCDFSTKVMIVGAIAGEGWLGLATDPASLHLEIHLLNSYDYSSIEGQPSLENGRLISQFDQPMSSPLVEYGYTAPMMSGAELAANMREAARAYKNDQWYGLPDLTGSNHENLWWGYNSNSYVSGVLWAAGGVFPAQLGMPMAGNAWLLPGFWKPLPIPGR